ncbi:UNVERIFIED_CONTAM: hypothetical protein Slati_1402500 [Sesamum latifolium]|uniref:Reverse transcriptase n=1 Tax=Sesamum latifolium TaxID=2727402 RepID=A0AAW2X4E4_9LAMI
MVNNLVSYVRREGFVKETFCPRISFSCAEAFSGMILKHPRALMCIRTLLSLFENASGLKINLLKSAMVISHNVEMERRQEQIMYCDGGNDKYLGLPTGAGWSKKELFKGIKDRIWSKLHNWSAKKLS